jgi:hypothetical protein
MEDNLALQNRKGQAMPNFATSSATPDASSVVCDMRSPITLGSHPSFKSSPSASFRTLPHNTAAFRILPQSSGTTPTPHLKNESISREPSRPKQFAQTNPSNFRRKFAIFCLKICVYLRPSVVVTPRTQKLTFDIAPLNFEF